MTELQWLIKMLTTHKLSTSLKDVFIERIGEVESNLSKPVIQQSRPTNIIMGGVQQAPSMQRIIDETPITAQGSVLPPKPVAIDKETGRAMVQTGKGTMGPRKF